MKDAAVFLDRDGTIIEDSGYLDDPEKVRLLPGAAEAVRRFHAAGFRVIVASNQSGVARGYFTEKTLLAVHERMESLLKRAGAPLDAAYYCPFLAGDEATVETYRKDSPMRKPKPGMLLQAAKDLDLDLRRSWMVGDSPTDVEAGAAAGCRTVLIPRAVANASSPSNAARERRVQSPSTTLEPTARTTTLLEAANLITARAIDEPSPRLETGDASSEVKSDVKSEVRGNELPAPTLIHAPSVDSPPVVDPWTSMPTREDATPREAAGAPLKTGDPIHWLERIHETLDRAHRSQRQHDFSVLRLLGTLLQMIALVAAAWGLAALFTEDAAFATARLTLACFFQLAAATAFGVDRFR